MWLREDPFANLLRFSVLVCRVLSLFLSTSLQSVSAPHTVWANTCPFWFKRSHVRHMLWVIHSLIPKVTQEYFPLPSPILLVFPWVSSLLIPFSDLVSIHLIVLLVFSAVVMYSHHPPTSPSYFTVPILLYLVSVHTPIHFISQALLLISGLCCFLNLHLFVLILNYQSITWSTTSDPHDPHPTYQTFSFLVLHASPMYDIPVMLPSLQVS
jgi:hypothetical protein